MVEIGNDFELLDTPGILWPKFESEEVGNKLALTGAIKDALLHMDDIALFALSQFKLDYPEYLKKAYRLTDDDLELSNVDLLMLITKNLGFKEDYEKASERIVFDIRSGKLGRYTLDQAPVSVNGGSIMEKRSIKEIKLILEEIQTLSDERLTELRSDERKGVQDLIAKFERQYAKKAVRAAHFEEMQSFERAAKQKGYKMIAGIDEVGRGPLAGPVVAAAVILPEGMEDIGLDDSKKLSAKKRAEIFEIIKEQAIAIGIGIVDAFTIDKINIYEASKVAMKRAIELLPEQPDYLLIDAMKLDTGIPEEGIIKGDAKSISIAAASIVAKEVRDQMMKDYEQLYPGYGFAQNAGYGTKAHLEGLAKLGPTPIHRMTFAPVKDYQ